MSLAIDNICFAWTGDFDSLKVLVAKDLELSGIWEHPGGDKNYSSLTTVLSRGEKLRASYSSKVTRRVR